MANRADLERTVRSSGDDTIIDVWVVPGARATEVVGVHDDALRIRVAAPPEGGKANQAVERILGEVFGVRPVIEAGRTSRRKQLRVLGRTPEKAVETLHRHLGGSR
jgi:uncharacterized protein (TIGR00251 family)